MKTFRGTEHFQGSTPEKASFSHVFNSPSCPIQLDRYMLLIVIINPVGYSGKEIQNAKLIFTAGLHRNAFLIMKSR